MTVWQITEEANRKLDENIQPFDHLPKIEQIGVYWPILRLALMLLRIFTFRENRKNKINEIIAWGDAGFAIYNTVNQIKK